MLCYLYTLYNKTLSFTNISYICYALLKERFFMNKKTENKILLSVPNSLLKEIEDYQFENRIKSRSEAIRQLIKKGLFY